MFGKKRLQEAEYALLDIPFEEVLGKSMREPLTLFALSTCGFCRRAKSLLDDNKYSYRYIYVDKLSREQQNVVRTFIKLKYKIGISYPFLCVGKSDFFTGFIRASWEMELKELCDE
jgi:glutaredoxin